VAMAQKITGIRFGYFVSGAGLSLPAANTITIAGYTGQTENESFVSENPKTAAALIALIKKLKANGTADINKCFTPRHCITLLNGETVVYRALICFECDGIRFSNQKNTSAIKSVENREKWMQELKRYFTSAHFDINGITKKKR
jgi:hypothetical protein